MQLHTHESLNKSRLPAITRSALRAPKIASLRLRKALRLHNEFGNTQFGEKRPFVEAGEFRERLFDTATHLTSNDELFRERNITITRSAIFYKDERYALDTIVNGFVQRLWTEKWPLAAGVLYILLGLIAVISSNASAAGLSAALACAGLGGALVYRDLTPSYILVLEFNIVVASQSTYPQTLYFETYDGSYINRVYDALENALFG